jgi:undecaprenyl-diphosphatase
MARFDEAAEARIAPLRGRRFADLVFYTASAIGEFSFVWITLALLRAWRGGQRDRYAARRTIAGALVETVLVNGLIKSFVGRTRPIAPFAHPLPFRQPLTSSFPSGHASAAFFAATLLAEDDPLGPLYFALAAIVATSRLYVRIHHASDVVGGAVLGLLLGQLARALAPLPNAPES